MKKKRTTKKKAMKAKQKPKKTAETMALIAVVIVLLSAMWHPMFAFILALLTLIVFSIYKFSRRQ